MPSDTSLTAFIASHPDARELKRALAVHMTQLGFKQRVIQSILGVPSSFISTWKNRYQAEGVDVCAWVIPGRSRICRPINVHKSTRG